MPYFNRVRLQTGNVEDGRTIAPGEQTWIELPGTDRSGTDKGAWVDAREERAPDEKDADEFGCVLAFHIHNGVMVTGWKQFRENRFLTHWQRTPRPPKTQAELMDSIKKSPRVRE